jgi:hypothetical protein
MASCQKKEGDMGLDEFYFFWMIRIGFRIEECFLQGGKVHKKLHSMPNAKVQISKLKCEAFRPKGDACR